MAFILRMTFRELRASWRRLAFFFLCVAVGVGGIVALRSLIQNVRVALAAEARTLTAGDISVQSGQEWTEDIRAVISAQVAALPGAAWTETVDTTTMVRLVDETSTLTKVVELRGVQSAFPFYGQLELGEQPYSFDLLADHGALVGPELLTQLGLSVGGQFAVGDVVFSGGEIPAVLMIDAIVRTLPGALGDERSAERGDHGVGGIAEVVASLLHQREVVERGLEEDERRYRDRLQLGLEAGQDHPRDGKEHDETGRPGRRGPEV